MALLVARWALVAPLRRPLSHYSGSRSIRAGGRGRATRAAGRGRARSRRSVKEEEAAGVERVKRRTRSGAEVDLDLLRRYGDGSSAPHVPVLLCEVLHAFRPLHLRSFLDCTLGAAGHSSAMIEAHEEMELFVGMDMDPSSHNMARTRIQSLMEEKGRAGTMRACTHAANFKNIKQVLQLDHPKNHPSLCGVDGILMDLGMSSMQVDCSNRGFSVLQDGPLDMRMDPQADLKAEDILNGWPESEIGRILRDYGEESKWRYLQKQIVKARATGGLHSTAQLVELVRKNTGLSTGRQGWIKTATRVFQALRIAVNNELETLEESLHSCFECLAPGGRLAVISFHSLEDRIVKQTFLHLIKHGGREAQEEEGAGAGGENEIEEEGGGGGENEIEEEEGAGAGEENEIEEDAQWYKHRVHGRYGTILTKRPITPSVQEEKLNPRCRSAKLRLLHKSSSA